MGRHSHKFRKDKFRKDNCHSDNSHSDNSHSKNTAAPERDGIVTGTADGDLIIPGFTDWDGDQVDGGDAILPGEGPQDDIIYALGGNDTVRAGEGDDEVYGGDGDDLLFGDAGDDLLHGGSGDDVIHGGEGNDTLFGGTGDDVIEGGAGDDVILGGSGDNTLSGGAGNDLIIGGPGANLLSGGSGRDVFAGVTAGDTVDGGSGGDDYDVLDLRGSAPENGALRVTITGPDSNGNGFDGIVTYFDADGVETGTLTFTEIEQVIPCFTPGTRIATPRGAVPVEALRVGDPVLTRDSGLQPIRWIGSRVLGGAELARAPHLRPVLIRRGALGGGLPERDMMVSPNHRVLVANAKTALLFETSEVLVAAKHLTGMDGIEIVEVEQLRYLHVMFDQHEVILSDGVWTESFQPGDQTLGAIGAAQRAELLELFPELATRAGVEAYVAARRSLKRHEARLLVG